MVGPRKPPKRPRLTLEDHVQGVLDGNRSALARAITLIESRRPAHQAMARQLLDRLMPHTGGAHRIGITGVPGVGKSTFIEAFGTHLTDLGHRIAVLTIDPSSVRTGGSILGDKTRMTHLSANPNAFIRPSPTSGTLGGVARRTREAMLLCEAAGFDIVLIETVGVGQSEITVAGMTDFFLVLMLSGAGDELQGIKRGLMELADMLAINKADGDNTAPAQRAAAIYQSALRTLHPPDDPWQPPVKTCSALEKTGLAAIWSSIAHHRRITESLGLWAARRRSQNLQWLWSLVDERLRAALRDNPRVKAQIQSVEDRVGRGQIAATTGAEQLLGAFFEPG